MVRRHSDKLSRSSTMVAGATSSEPGARVRAIRRGDVFAQEDLEESGRAYGVDDVRTLLHGISRRSVDKKVAEGALLAVPGADGGRRFPSVQFNDDGSVVAGLKEVQLTLGYESRWAVLNFLISCHGLLDGQRPIDLLRKGSVEDVVRAARADGIQGG